MKAQNKVQKVATWILLALALTTAACAKKDSGGSGGVPVGVAPVGIAPNCSNCGNLSALLGTVRTLSPMGDTEMAADIYGDVARVNAADPKTPIYYTGPVVLKANYKLNITNACQATVGPYVIETMVPGEFMGSTMYNLRLVAIGNGHNGRIEMTLLQGRLVNGQDPNGISVMSATNRMYTELRYDVVNGQPCGLIYSTY